jgi:hypothetical protein
VSQAETIEDMDWSSKGKRKPVFGRKRTSAAEAEYKEKRFGHG